MENCAKLIIFNYVFSKVMIFYSVTYQFCSFGLLHFLVLLLIYAILKMLKNIRIKIYFVIVMFVSVGKPKPIEHNNGSMYPYLR